MMFLQVLQDSVHILTHALGNLYRPLYAEIKYLIRNLQGLRIFNTLAMSGKTLISNFRFPTNTPNEILG